jgi:flavin reductase (DIM6/NTAB) family NADH-FMN oxidoreductase RutF
MPLGSSGSPAFDGSACLFERRRYHGVKAPPHLLVLTRQMRIGVGDAVTVKNDDTVGKGLRQPIQWKSVVGHSPGLARWGSSANC